jgi:hypothetical protein
VEFAPDWRNMGRHQGPSIWSRISARLGFAPASRGDTVTHYDALVERMLAKPEPNFPWIRCVTPGFDNSARRARAAAVIVGSTPSKYQGWLRSTIARSKRTLGAGDGAVVFINAWNEWGEGNYLEPDLKWGHQYLQATKAALD